MSDEASHMLKGQEVNLTEVDPGLHRVMIGLGWGVPEENHGSPVDLDASAFLLTREDRVRMDTDFIFYNNLETEEGTIKHLGDATTGDGGGDDEKIEINLDSLPYDVEKIAFSVTIHNAEERLQNFGIVNSAFIRIANLDTGVELARFDLAEDASEDTGFVFGELSREGTGWKFKAIGQGSSGGLYEISCGYNVNVAPP